MKLYWRVKINGKWTWRPAQTRSGYETDDETVVRRIIIVEELDEDGR
jgi:hypothetical protein